MTKYKVGDIVIVNHRHSNGEVDDWIGYVGSMVRHAGHAFKIKEAHENSVGGNYYRLENFRSDVHPIGITPVSGWWWKESWLSPQFPEVEEDKALSPIDSLL